MSYDKFFETAKQVRKGQAPAKAPSQVKQTKAEIQNEENGLRKKMNVRPQRRKASFPIIPVLLLAAVSTLFGWWSVDPELPDRILKRIDIQMVGFAGAESGEKAAKKSESKGDASAKAAAKPGDAGPDVKPTDTAAVSEDLSHLQKLRERKDALDLREKELNELEEELQKQKAEIEARIKRLEDMRAQITNVLKDRVEVDQEKVMKLVETYSNMKPKQAADILSGLDEDLAVEVVSKMKKKNAAEIMNLLEPAKARAISEKYAGYKAR